MSKDLYTPCLLQLFRQHGYDGTTLVKIAEATGLGKASLYHHFPGGKDEMVSTVLDFLEHWSEEHLLRTLRSPGDALTRMQRMCDQLTVLYEGGQQPCLLAILLLGSTRDVFHDKVQVILRTWIQSIAAVLTEAGLEEAQAIERGEDAAIAIQGALIVSQGLNDPKPFQRVVQQLPQALCRDLQD